MNLKWSMKYAFAVELGAYTAYEGHAAVFEPGSEPEATILRIRREELRHAAQLRKVLRTMRAKPNPILNAAFLLMGTVISLSCSWIGLLLANVGATVIERLNWLSYLKMARQARKEGKEELAEMFRLMAVAEHKHELALLEL